MKLPHPIDLTLGVLLLFATANAAMMWAGWTHLGTPMKDACDHFLLNFLEGDWCNTVYTSNGKATHPYDKRYNKHRP